MPSLIVKKATLGHHFLPWLYFLREHNCQTLFPADYISPLNISFISSPQIPQISLKFSQISAQFHWIPLIKQLRYLIPLLVLISYVYYILFSNFSDISIIRIFGEIWKILKEIQVKVIRSLVLRGNQQ